MSNLSKHEEAAGVTCGLVVVFVRGQLAVALLEHDPAPTDDEISDRAFYLLAIEHVRAKPISTSVLQLNVKAGLAVHPLALGVQMKAMDGGDVSHAGITRASLSSSVLSTTCPCCPSRDRQRSRRQYPPS